MVYLEGLRDMFTPLGIIETIKAHNISSGGSHVAYNDINIVRMVKEIMYN